MKEPGDLISAETTEKDSTFSTFNPKTKMIKIINDTHFAFFNHDLNNGKNRQMQFSLAEAENIL